MGILETSKWHGRLRNCLPIRLTFVDSERMQYVVPLQNGAKGRAVFCMLHCVLDACADRLPQCVESWVGQTRRAFCGSSSEAGSIIIL